MQYFIGIDPGFTGATAIIDDEARIVVTQPFSSWKEAAGLLQRFSPDKLIAGLEHVHAYPGQGVSSSFNFGSNYGGHIACLEVLSVPYVLVSVAKWQKNILGSFPKGESKNRAAAYIGRRYPELTLRKKDTGIIDALCIALYIRDTH